MLAIRSSSHPKTTIPSSDATPGGPSTPINRNRFLAWGAIPTTVLLFVVFMSRGAEPSKAPGFQQQDECAKLLEKIKAIEEELVAIRERKPPFDKMDQAEINDNIAYRNKEITLHKSRRYALGCPGAEVVVLGDSAAAGGAGSGGLAISGGTPGTLETAGLTLKEYAETINGARYVQDDPQTCLLPGDGASLTVGSPSTARFNPGNLADGEFTSEVTINGIKARAGSIGEDMQGYWGAVISWNFNGLTYTVEMTAPYPEMKDDTPQKRQELYEQCLKRSMEAALPFDKAMRKLK